MEWVFPLSPAHNLPFHHKGNKPQPQHNVPLWVAKTRIALGVEASWNSSPGYQSLLLFSSSAPTTPHLETGDALNMLNFLLRDSLTILLSPFSCYLYSFLLQIPACLNLLLEASPDLKAGCLHICPTLKETGHKCFKSINPSPSAMTGVKEMLKNARIRMNAIGSNFCNF